MAPFLYKSTLGTRGNMIRVFELRKELLEFYSHKEITI